MTFTWSLGERVVSILLKGSIEEWWRLLYEQISYNKSIKTINIMIKATKDMNFKYLSKNDLKI